MNSEKPKTHHYNSWTISQQGQKKKTKVKFRGTWLYWVASVRRINIFADTDLSAGYLEHGKIDLNTRLKVYHVFKEFMAQYEGKTGDKRPFMADQEDQIRHMLAGGLVVDI